RQSFQGVSRESELTGKSLKEATQAARLLSGSLVSELNPALGGLVSQMAFAGRGFSQYSAGAAIAGVATVALIAGITAYVKAVNEAAQKQAALNLAVRSLDAGAIRSQLQQAALEIETFSVRSQNAIGRLVNSFQYLGSLLGLNADPLKEQGRAQAALQRVLPNEIGRAQAASQLNQVGVTRGLYESF